MRGAASCSSPVPGLPDGCSTRSEVLLEEAVVAPEVTGRCTLTGSHWYSWYDDRYVETVPAAWASTASSRSQLHGTREHRPGQTSDVNGTPATSITIELGRRDRTA